MKEITKLHYLKRMNIVKETDTEIEIVDMSNNYEENEWGQHIKEDGPDGVTFKSKSMQFEEILGTLKTTLVLKNKVFKIGSNSIKAVSTQNKILGLNLERKWNIHVMIVMVVNSKT